MRPKRLSVTASAGGISYSPVYVVDNMNNPCNIAIGVVVTGSADYSVQHTFGDPLTTNLNIPANSTWFDNETLVSAVANGDTNYAFPPTGIRCQLRAAASATATMTIVQAGPSE